MKTRASSFIVARRRCAAFTMIEIAIALAVIAFALIAIIGILPTGLQINRDNREETIVNQDARLIVEAIKTAGRDPSSDIGSYVMKVDGTNYPNSTYPNGLPTIDLISILADTNQHHSILFRAISGAVATRGTDLGFRYDVRAGTNIPILQTIVANNKTNVLHLGTDIRLRFAWPVRADGTVANEANTFVTRVLFTGFTTNGVLYPQEYRLP